MVSIPWEEDFMIMSPHKVGPAKSGRNKKSGKLSSIRGWGWSGVTSVSVRPSCCCSSSTAVLMLLLSTFSLNTHPKGDFRTGNPFPVRNIQMLLSVLGDRNGGGGPAVSSGGTPYQHQHQHHRVGRLAMEIIKSWPKGRRANGRPDK